MTCCSNENIIDGVNYDKIRKQLSRLGIQIEPIWRGLYICPLCKTYWEEQFIDDRFGGHPYLKKVTTQYVKIEWGSEYLVAE